MSIETGNIIDQHRIAHVWSEKQGRTVECLCGHESQALYEDQITPITDENNPERVTQRAHADHVASMLELARQGIVNVQWDREKATPNTTFRAVERSTATKYQVSAFDHECPHLVVADLLRQAAMSIGREESIPTQIKIDRASAKRGEKITLTWFA